MSRLQDIHARINGQQPYGPRVHTTDDIKYLLLCVEELSEALLDVAAAVGWEYATIPPGSTPADVAGLIRDALASENARLRDALAAVVDAETHGIPGGYIGVYPDETDRYCTYCLTSWRMGEPERHDDDCPIAAARRVLNASDDD